MKKARGEGQCSDVGRQTATGRENGKKTEKLEKREAVTDVVKCNREGAKGTGSGASWWATIVRLFNVRPVSLIFAYTQVCVCFCTHYRDAFECAGKTGNVRVAQI